MSEIVSGDAIAGMAAARSDPRAVVVELSRSRYADADCVLFGGSAARGTYNDSSDIDLVVLFARLPNSRRETFVKDGWSIDAQLHDGETLNYVLIGDARLGSAILASFVIGTIPIPGETPLQQRIMKLANSIVDAGPPKADLSGSRYLIYNMLNDLPHLKDQHELIATASELYKLLALHVFRQEERWLDSRKMIPRVLREIDEQLELDFYEAFQPCFVAHDPSKVIALATRLIPDLSEAAKFEWTYPSQHRLKLK
jgi:predicted nucleotidyltransferase